MNTRAQMTAALLAGLLLAIVGCGGDGATTASGSDAASAAAEGDATAADTADAAGGDAVAAGDCDPAQLDPASLAPEGIVGRGPNDEEPAQVEDLELTDDEIAAARDGGFQVGIAMQTMDITWSDLQVQGITETLEEYGVEVAGVTDAGFQVEQQIADLENMVQLDPDAIISIPVDDTATSEAYRAVSEAGIELVFIHQPPRELAHPDDYAAVISPDNQGNGEIAAALLACHVPEGGVVGVLDFGIDFFTTNERTRRVLEWFEQNRPDIEIRETDFVDPSDAGSTAANFLTANPDINGLFAIWDAPAMAAVAEMRAQGVDIPITTIDLGIEVALEVAQGGLVVGMGAQEPYEQGRAEALATIKALVGSETPAFVALPAVPVTESNLLEAYEQIFQESPPAELVEACDANPQCAT